MFNFFKRMLRRPEALGADNINFPPIPQAYPKAEACPLPAEAAEGLPAHTSASAVSKGVELPLAPIVDGLPLELQPRLVRKELSGLNISVPLEKVLAQLSKGCVTISFGELRHAAPGVFTAQFDRDSVQVTLPLGEILSRLNPALITRRRAQRQVEIPDEITSPFDTETPESLVLSAPVAEGRATNGKSTRFGAGHAAAPSAGNVGLPPQDASKPGLPAGRSSLATAAVPEPPSALPLPSAPQVPQHSRPIAFPTNGANGANGNSKTNGNGSAHPMPNGASGAAQAEQEAPIFSNLASLAEAWPEAIRKEIVDQHLVDAKVAMPFSAVGMGLKQGRLVFTWKVLRSWIVPAVRSAASLHDGELVELPLKVVAPAYLARQQQNAKPQAKVQIDEDIPNLFFGFPQPSQGSSGSAANARPEDTNYYVWGDVSDEAKVDQTDYKKSPSPGTRFVSKYATPNEIVSKAAALPGVAGALIALPDGLMVANKLSPEFNGETLAAFLPQIFGKVSQCTKELRMGELNNLNFTVGNVPWKIFRVNAIFFAAFGRQGEGLPTAQLASLAAELDHKPRN